MRRRLDPRVDHTGLDYRPGDELPLGWRHPVTGRRYHRDDPALERLGIYLRRARYIAMKSQMAVATAAGVHQSQYSRLERALAPAMDVERLAWIEDALDGAFPLGYCPHEHPCRWRRLNPRADREAQEQEDYARASATIDMMFGEDTEEEAVGGLVITAPSDFDPSFYAGLILPPRPPGSTDE
jgi:transcriptional regulator with XRE-family HTH domain